MKKLIIAAISLTCAATSSGMQGPRMNMIDKIRIREAILISQKFGDSIWNGINRAPFAIILVTDSIEFLVHHPNPPAGFALSERDTVLRADIFWRKRQFSASLLATFPVNGVNCIVAGTAEHTGKHSAAWIITLLHEHFHQYVYSQPGYYADVEKLDLSGGDKTGMWMLNYPFPYGEEKITGLYNKYISSLTDAAGNVNAKDFKNRFKKYSTSRKNLGRELNAADYRYFSFQVWQEGIARYTEYKFLEKLSGYNPSNEMAGLPDYISFDDYRKKFLKSQYAELTSLKLAEAQRVCFYAIGFAEGILLDKLNPGWRLEFFKQKFKIESCSNGYLNE